MPYSAVTCFTMASMKQHYTPFCLQVEIIGLILINHTALFSDSMEAQPASSCISEIFLPHLPWCWSRISTKSGISSAKGRGQKGQTCSSQEPPQCTPWCRGLDALVYGMYWDFFCPPHCPLAGLLCASPTVQGTGGFAVLRGRSWEEAGRQWSWDGGPEVGQPGWEIKRGVGG